MKITKTEGIWLIITTILYIAYNIPGVPPLQPADGNAHPRRAHGAAHLGHHLHLPPEGLSHLQAEKRKEGG